MKSFCTEKHTEVLFKVTFLQKPENVPNHRL